MQFYVVSLTVILRRYEFSAVMKRSRMICAISCRQTEGMWLIR